VFPVRLLVEFVCFIYTMLHVETIILCRLYCGYNKTLRVFDIARPGKEFSQYSTLTKTKDGQTGIISCLAFSPGTEGLLAAGSYNRTTALYSENNCELLFVLHGQEGGVTQVRLSLAFFC
jgi:WD40 repeat protein